MRTPHARSTPGLGQLAGARHARTPLDALIFRLHAAIIPCRFPSAGQFALNLAVFKA